MYVIVVYDVREERVNRACKFLKRFLPRVQNSVFEGELSESKLERVRSGLKAVLDLDQDSVLIYVLRDARWMERLTLGVEKLPITNIL